MEQATNTHSLRGIQVGIWLWCLLLSFKTKSYGLPDLPRSVYYIFLSGDKNGRTDTSLVVFPQVQRSFDGLDVCIRSQLKFKVLRLFNDALCTVTPYTQRPSRSLVLQGLPAITADHFCQYGNHVKTSWIYIEGVLCDGVVCDVSN